MAKAMVATVEVYEPRMPSWVMVEPMNHTRGYHSSAVLGGSIFTFGGVKGEADTILDVVCSNSKSQFLPCPFGYLYCISYSTKLTPIIMNLQSHIYFSVFDSEAANELVLVMGFPVSTAYINGHIILAC